MIRTLQVILNVGIIAIIIGCKNNDGHNYLNDNISIQFTEIQHAEYEYDNSEIWGQMNWGEGEDFVHHFSIKYDFPLISTNNSNSLNNITDKNIYIDSIRKWVESKVLELIYSFCDYKGDLSSYNLDSCYSNPDIYVKRMCTAIINCLSGYYDITDPEEIIESCSILNVEYELEIDKVYENDNCITYLFKDYYYDVGDQRGSDHSIGATFSKKDGKRLGWNLLNTRDLTQYYRRGLEEYFAKLENVSLCDIDIEKICWETTFSNGTIVPPRMDPYLVPCGLCFTYDRYAITSGQQGMPSFVIPIDSIQQYLSRNAKLILFNKIQ